MGVIQGAHDVCPGDSLRLSIDASGWLPSRSPTYQWFVDGQPVGGATASAFIVPTVLGGRTLAVAVRVADGEAAVTSNAVSVTIKPLLPPVLRFTISPSVIEYGQKVTLLADAEPSECGGRATIRFSASDGTISGNIFDSSTVRSTERSVRITANATDQKNSASSGKFVGGGAL